MRIGVDLGARARIGFLNGSIGARMYGILSIYVSNRLEPFRTVILGIAVCISNIYLDQHRGSR